MKPYRVELEKRLGDLRIEAGFDLEDQGILALFGPSGAGKTSIVNMIAGLLTPDRGRIVISGATVHDSRNRIDLPPYKRRIGYVFQDARLFPHYTVRGNLNYGRNRRGPENGCVEFDDVVEVLGIGGLLSRRPHHLSGGEKQRVAIGRALLTGPRLLLMDEPVSSVDQARKQEILNLVAALPARFQVPILYVTHSPEEIAGLSATVLDIRDGVVSNA
ncbi:MAG: molybdenum ABC transporter ATP-binding protein [Proteobacteria bacterium]|nr:molybdenum ABC transporter ATP-binding protein [Pseudomonadota bacterium]